MVESVMEIGFTFIFTGIILGLACLLLGISSNLPLGIIALGTAIVVCEFSILSFDRFIHKVIIK